MNNNIISKISMMLAVIICAFALSGTVSADESASSYITVESAITDPTVFMKGDTGTVTVTIKNIGENSVMIKRAAIFTKDLALPDEASYSTVGSIGPQSTKKFTFTLTAKNDGIFYPRFYIDFGSSGSLNYPLTLKVESTPVDISVSSKPDSFQNGVKSQIKLIVGNPRESNLTGVIVKPESDCAEFVQSSAFIGELGANKHSEVTFDMTPYAEGNAIFKVQYKNGINSHEETLQIPISFSGNKKGANIVVNGIVISGYGAGYRISGDVANAGLSNAESVVVTTQYPALPIDPNRAYVIGELEPDDFSGFEVDFKVGEDYVGTIPLLVKYKDNDGNDYTEIIDVDAAGTIALDSSASSSVQSSSSTSSPASSSSQSGTSSGSANGDNPMFIIIVVVFFILACVAVGYAVSRSWKNVDLKSDGRKKL